MISVHVSTKVEKCIQNMKQTGKAGRMIARKVAAVIESLTSGDMEHHMKAVCSYTKYGEKRIKNCRKYDLGCGYRLITLHRGEIVFIPFLGSHDECQRWLANHSRLRAFHAGKGKTVHIEDKKSSPTNLRDVERIDRDMDADYDRFLQNLTDKELRYVFKGLVDGGKRD